jgi:hypothetical protein
MAKALRSCSQSQSFFSPNPVHAHSLVHRERLLGSFCCSTVLFSSPDFTDLPWKQMPMNLR